MARRRLVLCPWALALITGIHQAEGVADPARNWFRRHPHSTGGHPPISLHPPLYYTTLSCAVPTFAEAP